MSVRDPRQFPTTRLSLIDQAKGVGQGNPGEAVAKICGSYWFPLYAYVRRAGFSTEDAQDLTQQFFVVFLEREYIHHFEPERGRLRTFLIAALKHFLANERDRVGAKKRGGGLRGVSMDLDEKAETRYLAQLRHGDTPETIYEREWACTLLDACREELRSEYERRGKSRLFERIDLDEMESCYSDVAASLGMNEGALKVAVHRLRRRLREILRRRIAETVYSPSQVDAEVQHVWTTLGRN